VQEETTQPIRANTQPKFSAADKDVKQGLTTTVARAVSTNMAKRIANALNAYTPDKRGQ
jgi:hypothetical protein